MCKVEIFHVGEMLTHVSCLGDIHCVITHMDLVFSVMSGVQFDIDFQK